MDGTDKNTFLYIMSLHLKKGTSIFIRNNAIVDYFLNLTNSECFCDMEMIIKVTKTPTVMM